MRRRRQSKEVKTSPPESMRRVRTMSWELEKDSSSTVSMLETVLAETLMKNKSRWLGGAIEGCLMGRARRRRKPREEARRK